MVRYVQIRFGTVVKFAVLVTKDVIERERPMHFMQTIYNYYDDDGLMFEAHKIFFFPRYWRRESTQHTFTVCSKQFERRCKQEIEIIRPYTTATYIRAHHHHICSSLMTMFYMSQSVSQSAVSTNIVEKEEIAQKVSLRLAFKAVHLLQTYKCLPKPMHIHSTQICIHVSANVSYVTLCAAS